MNSQIIVISSPERVSSEHRKIRELFQAGLQQLNVRKPGFSDFDMINYLSAIPKEFHKYLVLHSHYYLAKELGLKGIQVGKDRITEAQEYKNDFAYFGYSAHSFDEVLEYKDLYSHFFLSPVYNSISKADYESNFTSEELSSFIAKHKDIKLIALGGINSVNSQSTLDLGFSALALLGAIWQEENTQLAINKMQESLNTRPFVLSIAGFDPSSGAGVTADIKTLEQYRVQGLGVSTAITYQNESEFLSLDWLSFEQIKKQIDALFSIYQVSIVKLGLIESLEVLEQTILLLKGYNKEVKIIWDPILKASANFSFHNKLNAENLKLVLQQVYLITPNIPECEGLFNTSDFEAIQKEIKTSKLCKVLVKGGHSSKRKGTDVLIEPSGIIEFEGRPLKYITKHGTGCVLSSAICANLAKGKELSLSIQDAKEYIADFIDSNKGLLGFHNTTNK